MAKVHIIDRRNEHGGKPGHAKKDSAGTPREANLRLALARASLVKEANARAKARTKTTKPSQSVSDAARQAT